MFRLTLALCANGVVDATSTGSYPYFSMNPLEIQSVISVHGSVNDFKRNHQFMVSVLKALCFILTCFSACYIIIINATI